MLSEFPVHCACGEIWLSPPDQHWPEIDDSLVDAAVTEAISLAGRTGTVVIERGTQPGMHLAASSGLRLPVGSQKDDETVLTDPYLLLVAGKIACVARLQGVLEAARLRGAHLLVVAEELTDEVMTYLSEHQVGRGVHIAAVALPKFTQGFDDALADLAVLSDGTVFETPKGPELADATMAQLGRARRVVVTRDSTYIQETYGYQTLTEELVTELADRALLADSEVERLHLVDRVNRLRDGVVTISVGAPTDTAFSDTHQRLQSHLELAALLTA